MTIKPDTDEVPQLLDALEAFAEQAELSPKAAHRLTVVIEELAANVAMHGSTGEGAATYVAVTVTPSGEELVVTIEDDGRAYDPLAREEVDTEAALEDRDIGGLGIHFVKKMTKALTYVRAEGCNRLTAVLDVA